MGFGYTHTGFSIEEGASDFIIIWVTVLSSKVYQIKKFKNGLEPTIDSEWPFYELISTVHKEWVRYHLWFYLKTTFMIGPENVIIT